MKSSGKEVNSMRLHVYLAHSGLCSRRKAFDYVKGGHVTLNGKRVVEPSAPVNPLKDDVCFQGKKVLGKAYDYIMLNKPEGFVTTKSDQHRQKSVLKLLPKKMHHCSPVGRLDKDTEGLLLFTNDGDCAYSLTHPKFNVDKTYAVKVKGTLGHKSKLRLEKGILIDGKKTASAKVKNVSRKNDTTDFLIIIHEGRKRQIRLMCSKLGHQVVFLKRLQQGPVRLGNLKKGQWRHLKNDEVALLKG